MRMCIYMCVEVVLINVLALHLAPPNKNSWLRPVGHIPFVDCLFLRKPYKSDSFTWPNEDLRECCMESTIGSI